MFNPLVNFLTFAHCEVCSERLTHAADSCTLTNIQKKGFTCNTSGAVGQLLIRFSFSAHLPDVTDVQSLPSFIPLRETCYTETSFTINQWFHFSFWLLSVCLYWFLMELPRHESHDCFLLSDPWNYSSVSSTRWRCLFGFTPDLFSVYSNTV